jgi:hypothetical protein
MKFLLQTHQSKISHTGEERKRHTGHVEKQKSPGDKITWAFSI